MRFATTKYFALQNLKLLYRMGVSVILIAVCDRPTKIARTIYYWCVITERPPRLRDNKRPRRDQKLGSVVANRIG